MTTSKTVRTTSTGIYRTIVRPLTTPDEVKAALFGPSIAEVLECCEAETVAVLRRGGYGWPQPPLPDRANREVQALARKIDKLPKIDIRRGRKAAEKAKRRREEAWEAVQHRLSELQRAAGIIPHDAEPEYKLCEELLGLIASIRQLNDRGEHEQAQLPIWQAAQLAGRLVVLPFDPMVREAKDRAGRARQARTELMMEKAHVARRLVAKYQAADHSKTKAVEMAADEMTRLGYGKAKGGKKGRVSPRKVMEWLSKLKGATE
jgi:hypothetical protein